MQVKLNTLKDHHRHTAIRALKDQIYQFKKDNLLNEVPTVEAALKALREPEIKQAQKAFDKIKKVMQDAGIEIEEFYPYSGRGMYGTYCVAVTVDRYQYNSLVKLFQKKKIGFSSDNMGMDMVVYFQHLDPKDVLSEEVN